VFMPILLRAGRFSLDTRWAYHVTRRGLQINHCMSPTDDGSAVQLFGVISSSDIEETSVTFETDEMKLR
jgi:hypothetical protein